MSDHNKLPFEGSATRNKQKFQCFCCGRAFEDYTGYKLHIEEDHEQGREWIRCPRCEGPVRDLKLHWKVKHSVFPYPIGVQDRAIIWKDFSPRGPKTRKPRFRNGTFISNKQNGKKLTYRSGMEAEVYECLESMPEVVAYDVEPLEIPYLLEGVSHIDKPDISILFLDGHKELWEVKPASQTSLPVNDAKWTYATEYCEKRGWNFMVLTEVGLGKLKRRAQEKKNPRGVL